jgi:hypothetical protein
MVRVDDSGEVTKCWLDRDELERLEEAAVHEDWEREIAIQLMARYGLRASEVSYPGNAELQYSDDADGWMPDRVEDCERAANAPFFPSVGAVVLERRRLISRARML